MNMNKNRLVSIALAVLITLLGAGSLYALRPPHDKASNNITCGSCHKTGVKIRGFNPLCVSECHNTLSSSNAKRKPLDLNFASNIFGTFTNVTPKKQFSHAWSTQPNYSTANKNNKGAGTNKYISLNQASVKGISGTSTIICSKCHYAHGVQDSAIAISGGTINKPFIRVSTKGDFICFQCHEERRVGAGSVRSAPVAGKAYSHPVEVNYSTIRAGKSDFYETSPTNTYGLPSANLPLYTTYGNVKGAVVCSTCHGPLHSADSNPYTLDNISAFSMGNYSTGDGYLLRRYNTSKSNDICKSCHKVETHQTATKCSDCHEPHKKAGDTNIYLIKKVIATPYGNHSVFFISTTQMAKRYGIYSGSVATNFRERSTAICQVCHRTKQYHRAYSTVGAKRDHSYDPGTGKFKNCVGCHPHTSTTAGGAFKLGGEAACGACHESPPLDAADGKHFKHIGADGGSNYNWLNGAMLDERGAERYGFSCGRCHSPWAPYTSSQNWPRHRTTSTYDDNTIQGYTTEYGFKIRTAFYPLNTKGDYVRAASGVSDPGKVAGGSRFSWSNGTCRNLYCHGQFFGGYTSANPTWNGTLPTTCSAGGSCHGTTSAKLPGVNGVGEWGAHRRHLGSAAGQYGTAGTFWCNACHSTTASLNNATTLNRIYHVNGKTNVKFAAAYQTAASRYGVLNDYSGRTNISETVKTQYQTCGLVYCHSDGSRMSNFSAPFDIGNKNFPNWSSTKNYTTTVSGVKRRCVRCHGNSTYKGITASMPGYATRPGKGNAHDAHIKNRILCYACHTQTVAADNRTVTVGNHVDKIYNVNMAASFGGTWDNGTKRCSNVKCHSQRLTPAWDTAARCQDCHYSSSLGNYTGERRGYNDSYKFRNWTVQNSAPRIYSSEWASGGHGRPGANGVCADCHRTSGPKYQLHATADSGNNPFRIFTAPDRPNVLCRTCHPNHKAHSQADMNWGDAGWVAFQGQAAKCVDCHDPHGDKNRGMVKKFINFTTGSNTYGKVSGTNFVRQVNFTTVGGNQMNWSSYVKSDYSGICQRCHNLQADMQNFNKAAKAGGGYSPDHFPRASCTSCHQHTEGFRPKDCNECHYFPPKDSRTPQANKMRHDRHVNWTSTPAQVAKNYDNTASNARAEMYNFACKKCHAGSHVNDTVDPREAEVLFDSADFPKNPSGLYARFSGWTETGASGADEYSFMYSSGKCSNLYCHGNFIGGKTTNVARFDNTSGPAANWARVQRCGACHGARNDDPPTGGAHVKHVQTYDLRCRDCHRDVAWFDRNGLGNYSVTDKRLHSDGKTSWRLYTTNARIGNAATYGNSVFGRVTTEAASPTYSFCMNTYCHSKGTDTTNPYNDPAAIANYTAKWGDNLAARFSNAGERCSYCHGNRNFKGITSAMPYKAGDSANQAHKVHVADNGFTRCYVCHANAVNSNNQISNTANHVNTFKNVSIIAAYKTGATNYGAAKTCANVKCHGGRTTPAWTAAPTGNCKDCHYSTTDTADYTFRNYSVMASVAAIRSSEWVDKGHGRYSTAGTGGRYPRSGNKAANRSCDKCHVTTVKHNTASNPFRLYTADVDRLCLNCHGKSANNELGKWGSPVLGNTTGYVTHSKSATGGNASWNFGQHPGTAERAKCVDCHDPHGDKNRYMVSTQVNYTGTDRYGVPSPIPSGQMNFTAVGGNLFNWSSYVRSDNAGLCQRCHTDEGNMSYFNKGKYSNHNRGTRCTNCHKHKEGFKGAGCNGCHGSTENDAPPRGPIQNNWSSDLDADASTQGIHRPHTYNPGGKRALNNYAINPYACVDCHGPESDGRSETSHPTGIATEKTAGMRNMTAASTSRDKRSKFGKGPLEGFKRMGVVDDTCWNTGCHTPRAYTRTWKKPTKCDDCHGFRNTPAKDGIGAATYNVITSGSHKMHVFSSAGFRYAFACRNCHKYPANNYSTHYSGFVNLTFAYAPYTSSNAGYTTRGLSFKGFTTTGGEYSTCTNNYCHGRFSGGLNASPKWGDKTTATCGSCHATNNTLTYRHPKHIDNYNYSCRRCHNATTGAGNAIIDQRTHVNKVENVLFNSSTYAAGVMNNATGRTWGANDARRCRNVYCHSTGARTTGNTWHTRTTISNYTARWDADATTITGGKGCSLCHGHRSGKWGNAATYGGITSAMPTYPGQAHIVHVYTEKFRCNVCHASTVNAAGSIISYTNHVNGFKNISIISSYKSGQTAYSTTVASKKTCKNIKCHGGRTTPLWTATAIRCQDCHYTATDPLNNNNEVNYRFGQYSTAAARVYSSEWVTTGHGRTTGTNYRGSGTAGAGLTCRSCHRAAVLHNVSTAAGGNFFRLTGVGNGRTVNDMCMGCHGPTGSASKKANHHADTVTLKPKCIDCHDPHGDRNVYMAQRFVNWTVPSDSQGRPRSDATGAPLATAVRLLVFTSSGAAQTGGPAAQWGDYRRADNRGFCQTCHRSSTANFNKALDSTHNQGTGFSSRCAANCHKHTDKFLAGESGGGSACKSCHASIYNNMTSRKGARGINSYHHVMQSDSAARPYPNISAYQKGQVKDSSRTCLICHADHNVFSPDKNLRGTGNRAKNLRKDIFTTPTASDANSFARTDFWPAKRNASSRSDGSANYDQTYPSAITGGRGICISCHKNIQYKNTSEQVNDGSTRAMPFDYEMYTSSSHNFQVISGFNKVGTKAGQERSFRANCVKCHNDTLTKDKQGDSTYKYGLHDSQRPALLNLTGDASGNIRVQDVCYKCHSQDARPSYDYYSSVKMSTTSKLIKTAVVAKTSGHPVGENPGAHKMDEFYNATSATTTAGWNRRGYKSGRHVECADCHNTHGGNASITRKVGTPDGNKVSGSQVGTWGVSLNYAGIPKGGAPKYTKVKQVTYQHELCLKCHSGYAYYTGMPEIPSGGVDFTLAHVAGSTYDTIQPGIKQSDVAKDFNPNNPAFHPVIAKGRNQPLHNANGNWPAGGTIKYVLSSYSAPVGSPVPSGDTKFKGMSGLGWTFVPPYDQKSLIACSDCHQADNTGLGVAGLGGNAIKGSWGSGWATGRFVDGVWTSSGTDPAAVTQADGHYARVTASLATVEFDVAWTQGVYPSPDADITKVEAAFIGYGTGTKTTNDFILAVNGDGGAKTLSKTTLVFGSGSSRLTSEVTNATKVWSTIDVGTTAGQNNDTTEYSVKVNKQDTGANYLYFDYVGIDVTYRAAGDLRGPHGSLEKWLLQDVDKNVLFDADENGTLQRVASCTPGASCDSPNVGFTNTKAFCVNCHRADVYWGTVPAKANRSRATHPVGASQHADDGANVWGVACMNCHGGKGSSALKITASSQILARGGIHGIYGTNTLWGPFVGRPSGSFKVFNRPVGVRLLLGGTMAAAADTTSVYCYTNSAADGTGSCTSEAGKLLGDSYSLNSGQSDTLNYTYTGW